MSEATKFAKLQVFHRRQSLFVPAYFKPAFVAEIRDMGPMQVHIAGGAIQRFPISTMMVFNTREDREEFSHEKSAQEVRDAFMAIDSGTRWLKMTFDHNNEWRRFLNVNHIDRVFSMVWTEEKNDAHVLVEGCRIYYNALGGHQLIVRSPAATVVAQIEKLISKQEQDCEMSCMDADDK